MQRILLYDSTLREGSQAEGTSFTLEDKIKIARLLDEAGVPYIEGGHPFSNPKDRRFYETLREHPLKQARAVAFGATCRPDVKAAEDAQLRALVDSGTKAAAIFGKSWGFHVTEVLGTTLEENLRMIGESVAYLKSNGLEVIYDAEHFFDGYKADREYALATLYAAARGGADWVCLCDTNGGTLPWEIAQAVSDVKKMVDVPLGIHCHNDAGMAQGNTMSAVAAGCTMVQATLLGIGERCGNTDLFIAAANLQVKQSYDCLPQDSVRHLTALSTRAAELMNTSVYAGAPYVGRNAFAHKAGMHIDAMKKNHRTFEHVSPKSVGATREYLLSEVSGRMAVLQKARTILPDLTKDSPETGRILDRVKELESQGYAFETADASFELLVRKLAGLYHPYFTLRGFKVIVEEPALDGNVASAMVEVSVNGEKAISAGIGNGPINALDAAARRALEHFYPSLRSMRLTDFRVRVLDSSATTASVVRVIIESADEGGTWTTIGVSPDMVGAGWQALIDSLEYKLLRDQLPPPRDEQGDL